MGLTGGIASGKSTASQRFRELGACVLDADELSRHALDTDGACFRAVVDTFGKTILLEDGTVDRKALANIVFGDETQREKLNAIVHPYVVETLMKSAYAAQEDIVVFDVPLLIECGLNRMMDRVVVVAAPEEVRIRRIVHRNGVSEKEARARIDAQIPQDEQLKYADFVLVNDASVEVFRNRIDEVFRNLCMDIS